MCDLKWVTMGFARNYVYSVTNDELISEIERELLLGKGYRIIDRLNAVEHNVDVEPIHVELHYLLNEFQGRRCNAFLRRRLGL